MPPLLCAWYTYLVLSIILQRRHLSTPMTTGTTFRQRIILPPQKIMYTSVATTGQHASFWPPFHLVSTHAFAVHVVARLENDALSCKDILSSINRNNCRTTKICVQYKNLFSPVLSRSLSRNLMLAAPFASRTPPRAPFAAYLYGV